MRTNSNAATVALQAATAASEGGRLEAALQHAQEAVGHDPSRADAWFVLGTAALSLARLDEAEQAFAQALDRVPSASRAAARILVLRAQALVGLSRWADAEAAVSTAEHSPSTDPSIQDTLGTVLCRLNMADRALGHLQAAARACPNDAQMQFNCGAGLRFVGRMNEAEIFFERSIASSPTFTQGHLALAYTKRCTAETTHIVRLEQAYTRLQAEPDMAPVERARLGYALFKEYDDLGDTDRAWSHLQKANDVAAVEQPWDPRAEERVTQSIRGQLAPNELPKPFDSAAPQTRYIFIVGLPRSGTTLVERILAAHSQVRSMGETPVFPAVVARAMYDVRPDAGGAIASSRSAAYSSVDWAAVATQYRRETAFLSGGASFAIDKLPQNHMWVGFIRLAFPDAAVIHVQREPMDVLFGAFKLMMGAAHGWANRLDHLVEHFCCYRALMDHWKCWPGPAAVDVLLERLIANPEHHIRRVLDHCGLEFEDPCLRPHLAAGAVATSSAAQIRRPINADGIGAWHRYRAQLEPLRGALEHLGYVNKHGLAVDRDASSL